MHCSLAMTCTELAAAFQYLAQKGLDPGTGEQLLTPSLTKRTNWSPGLDPSGNSLAGTLALELLTTKTGMSIF